MKKLNTRAAKQTKNFSEQKLTIGLDLGDRSSWYCVLDEAGSVIIEQGVSTTPKVIREVFGRMPRCRIALETGMHSPWVFDDLDSREGMRCARDGVPTTGPLT